VHGGLQMEMKSIAARGKITIEIQDREKRENMEKLLLKFLVKHSIIPHIIECKSTMRSGGISGFV